MNTCPQCEIYATEITRLSKDLADLRSDNQTKTAAFGADNAQITQDIQTQNIMLDEIHALKAVLKAADALIYGPRTEYKAGSKKAALRDALAKLVDTKWEQLKT